jgi:hypothetical protein
MSIAAPLLVGLPSRQRAPQVPLMRAHLILEGPSSPCAARLPRYSFDKVGERARTSMLSSQLTACSRDRPRQACSFRLSLSCGEHAPARRARTLYSFLRILHVADSSAVFRASWWCCYKCAACGAFATGTLMKIGAAFCMHTRSHVPSNCVFSCTGLFDTVC